MQQYRQLVETILEKGTYKGPAREGMPGSLSYFGYQFRHNLAEGFPLLTTKKVNFKKIVVELLWFLRGDTNIKYLNDNGCDIWNEDAYNFYVKCLEREGLTPVSYKDFVSFVEVGLDMEELRNIHKGVLEHDDYRIGDCGAQYGQLWRKWDYFDFEDNGDLTIRREDQIKNLIEGLKKNPEGRRHIITAWNPSTLDQMALNACHALVQFNCRALTPQQRHELYNDGFSYGEGYMYTEEDMKSFDEKGVPRYYLDCQMYQRSADMFLGVPFNIASYALLTHILAKICNMVPGDFIHTFGDAHIYENHMDAIKLQMSREERNLPLFKLEVPSTIEEFEYLLLEGGLDPEYLVNCLKGYDPHPYIKAELSTGLINKK